MGIAELERNAMPARIAALPRDARGYPVPAFVPWQNGAPLFQVMSAQAVHRSITQKRCHICGGPLGKYLSFVIGPMCTVNRISADPPSHHDCAEYAVRVCPFLARPHMKRLPALPGQVDAGGFMEERNPGVTCLWTTLGYQVRQAQAGAAGVLLHLGLPTSVVWWAEGQPATREQVLPAFMSGCGKLLEIERKQVAEEGPIVGGSTLDRAIFHAAQWLPEEAPDTKKAPTAEAGAPGLDNHTHADLAAS